MIVVVGSLLFLASAVLAPWWLTVCIGIVLVSLRGTVPVLVIGGLLMDTLYGTALLPLGGYAYLYTTIFLGMGLLAAMLRSRAMN